MAEISYLRSSITDYAFKREQWLILRVLLYFCIIKTVLSNLLRRTPIMSSFKYHVCLISLQYKIDAYSEEASFKKSIVRELVAAL